MSRYQKSWTQAMQEVQESAALQLKMAFDDAKIKIKGTKGGKLVIDKKDKKKVEKVIAKQMKKPSDAKRILGSQIVFEEVELDEADYKYDGKVVKISKKNFSKVHKDFKNSTKGKERMLINDPKTGGSISVPVQFEEVELDEGKFKKGDIVIPNIGPHKGEKHTIIHDFKNGSYNISLNKKHSRYDQGAAKAKENQLKLVKEEVELAEKGTAYPATIDTLKKIVKDKQHQTVMFDKGEALVDLFSASAMVQVYDALKPATKKKFEAMIKSKEGFMKSQAFAMKMAK